MQLINFTYTQYFNKRYGKVGHLFQGRYKSILCDRDQYLLSLVRYIHLNPVRAGLVEEPEGYRWSGHQEYLGDRETLVDTGRVLGMFSEKLSQARRRYRNFVNEGRGEGWNEDFYRVIDSQILGDDRFVEQVESQVNRAGRPVRKRPIAEVLKAIQEVTGVREEEVLSRGRGEEVLFARGVLVGVWREMGCRLVDLQPRLRRDLSVLSRMSKTAESAKGRRAMGRVFEVLNARMQA